MNGPSGAPSPKQLFNLKFQSCGNTTVDMKEGHAHEKVEGAFGGYSRELLLSAPHAGSIFGMRNDRNPSFGFSLSIFSKAHATAELISSKSRGFIA